MTILQWIHEFYSNLGLSLTLVDDSFNRKHFIRGLIITLQLSALALVLSLVVGVAGAWAYGARSRLVRMGVSAYVQWFRNTPTIIQLYLFYFGLGSYFTAMGPDGFAVPMVSAFTWVVFCLAMYYGAFNAEVLRAGMESVPQSTIEAAEALGYSRFRAFVHIVLPLSFRLSLPALNNNFVNLIKATSLAYAIAVPELLYVSSQIWASSLNVTEMMNILLISYVTIVGAFVYAMTKLEEYLRIPGIGE